MILAGAATLRIVGSGSGLPLPLLNPDETNIVPRAWDVVHGGGLDPGWYDYPSLIFLALAPTQIGLHEPSYGAARVVAVLVGHANVAHEYVEAARSQRLQRFGGRPAGLHFRPAQLQHLFHQVPRVLFVIHDQCFQTA